MADQPYIFVFCEYGQAKASRKVEARHVDARRRDCARWLSAGRRVRLYDNGRLVQELRPGEALLSIAEEHLLAGCLAHHLGRKPSAGELSAAKRLLAMSPEAIQAHAFREALNHYRSIVKQSPHVDFAVVEVGRLRGALGLYPRVAILSHVGARATAKIPSSNGGYYQVTLDETPACGCEDHRQGTLWCKHAIALALALNWTHLAP